jgi:hypothetical protein
MSKSRAMSIQNALGLNPLEVQALREAARDAHLPFEMYCRVMLLAAAGFGGVVEHLDRVVDASYKVDRTHTKLAVKRG